MLKSRLRGLRKSLGANALAKIAGSVAAFAEKEGLQAHARSAVIRFEET